MNRNAIAASVLAAAVSISVAAQAAPIKIGYAPSTWDPSDFHGMMGSAVEAALDRAGAEYEFFIRAPSSEAAQAEQLGIVEDYIAQGVDYIIINPIDVKVQRVTFEKVLEAGIQLIVGNHSTPFPEEWGYQPMMFSGYSHKDAGLVLADYLVEKHGVGTKISIIHGIPGQITNDRAPEEYLTGIGLEIVYTDHADYDRIKGYDKMERILTGHPETEVVIAASSAMAVGAVEATLANGVAGEYAIYGAGGTLEELTYIEDGLLTGAWIRDPVAMGEAIGKNILAHSADPNVEIEPIFNSPIHLIDSVEKINQFVNPVIFTSKGLDFPRPVE